MLVIAKIMKFIAKPYFLFLKVKEPHCKPSHKFHLFFCRSAANRTWKWIFFQDCIAGIDRRSNWYLMLKFFLIHAKCFLCGYWDLFFVRSTTAFLSIDRNSFQVKSDTSAGTWANHFIFFTFTSIGKVNAQSSIHHFFIFYDFLSKFVQKIFSNIVYHQMLVKYRYFW